MPERCGPEARPPAGCEVDGASASRTTWAIDRFRRATSADDAAAQHDARGRQERAEVGERVGRSTRKSAGSPSARPDGRPSHRGLARSRRRAPRRGSGRSRAAPAPRGRPGRARANRRRRCRRRSARPASCAARIVSGIRSWSRRMWAAYAGNLGSPCAAYFGKLAIWTSVGTSATCRAAMTSIRSSVTPVPCSRQSMPAASRSGSDSVENTCAVTRAPSSCARAIAGPSASAGQHGARSPRSRSIQSPTSLTQPSPRAACRSPRRPGPRARSPRRSSGCSGACGRCADPLG